MAFESPNYRPAPRTEAVPIPGILGDLSDSQKKDLLALPLNHPLLPKDFSDPFYQTINPELIDDMHRFAINTPRMDLKERNALHASIQERLLEQFDAYDS